MKKKIVLLFMLCLAISYAKPTTRVKKNNKITKTTRKRVVKKHITTVHGTIKLDKMVNNIIEYDSEIPEELFVKLRKKQYSGNVKEFYYFSRWHDYLEQVKVEENKYKESENEIANYEKEVKKIEKENRKIREENAKNSANQSQYQPTQYQNPNNQQQNSQQFNNQQNTQVPRQDSVDVNQISK